MTNTKEHQQQLKDFLAAGGSVEQIPRGKSGYTEGQTRSAWGAPRKKPAEAKPDTSEDQ